MTRLGELVVHEWQENEHEYANFSVDLDILAESKRFLGTEKFSGRLRDAFPLAMSNVLKTLLYILTIVHNSPFLSIVRHFYNFIL